MRSVMWRRSLIASLLLACGCTGATPPPESLSSAIPPAASAAPSGPSPAASTSAAAPPTTAATPPPAAPALAIPPPLTEALAPLTRTFARITIPGIKRSIDSMDGRGPNDLWFITYEEMGDRMGVTFGGEVFQFDGKRTKPHGHACPYAMFGNIVVARDAVVVMGYRPWSRGVAPSFRASLRKGGGWNCDEDHGGYTTGITTSSGEHVWELSCDSETCRLEASGGPAVPLPEDHASFEGRGRDADAPVQALRMIGLSDGWMVRDGDDKRPWLLRFNGVTWAPITPLEKGMIAQDLWAEGEDVWIVLQWGGKSGDPAQNLLRWNGRALSLQPVPKGFAVRRVHAAHGRDVWFSGDTRALYQWDGTQLRQGEAPFDVADMWVGSGGEVWIVGPSTEAGGPPPGVVAHALPLPASAPAAKVTP